MKTFEIEVQELLARVVKVKAENVDDAFSKVKKMYNDSDIVLNYNDFVDVKLIDTSVDFEKSYEQH